MFEFDIPMLIIAAAILVSAGGCFWVLIRSTGELKTRVAKHNDEMDEVFRRIRSLERLMGVAGK